MRTIVLAALASLAILTSTARAQVPRDLGAYFVFAMRSASLKNLQIAGACGVGVNCPTLVESPQSSCGSAVVTDAAFGDGSAMVAARINGAASASFSRVFTLAGEACGRVSAREGRGLFVPPILPDVDGDGFPSCDARCTPDFGDVYAACGFPDPFPACDPLLPVLALPGQDCAIAVDVAPGNARCDLGAGVHGVITVQNGARIALQPGVHVVCGINTGTDVQLDGDRTTILLDGDLNTRDGSRVGRACGDLTILARGAGQLAFGRFTEVAATICAPERGILLGHSNRFLGRFIGDVVNADVDVVGACCP